jgi:hypothetical protein
VHTAKDDELGFPPARRETRQLQRVAGVVGKLDDLVALVVMPQDNEALAECGFGGRDPRPISSSDRRR